MWYTYNSDGSPTVAARYPMLTRTLEHMDKDGSGIIRRTLSLKQRLLAVLRSDSFLHTEVYVKHSPAR